MIRVGVDVGGTGIQVGAVDKDLNIVARGQITTHIDIPFALQVNLIANCVRETLEGAGLSMDDLEAVGVGIPGIASSTGEVIKCTNMNWHHVPFREEFNRHIDKPVFIENDANVAALAESVAGISAGSQSSVFITLGTGIGSGIIINGKIWSGAHGIGGELGHTILRLDGEPCTCGNHGCLERYCSATALIRMAREEVHHHNESLILKAADGDPININARIVIDAARQDDPIAVRVYKRYISYLSQAIANVINFLDPEIIVLGGGVSRAGAFLLDPIRKEFPKYVLFRDQPMARVELATLSADAGIIGAAMLS